MKVQINLTQDGYTKTVIFDNGNQETEVLERYQDGFKITKSIDFEDTSISDKMAYSLDTDFDLYLITICDALHTENQLIFNQNKSKTMKKGDIIQTVNNEHSIGENQRYNSVYCKRNGKVSSFQFTDNDLDIASKRANRNELDIPMVSTDKTAWLILICAVVGFVLGVLAG